MSMVIALVDSDRMGPMFHWFLGLSITYSHTALFHIMIVN